jgi:hypothetical protein
MLGRTLEEKLANRGRVRSTALHEGTAWRPVVVPLRAALSDNRSGPAIRLNVGFEHCLFRARMPENLMV